MCCQVSLQLQYLASNLHNFSGWLGILLAVSLIVQAICPRAGVGCWKEHVQELIVCHSAVSVRIEFANDSLSYFDVCLLYEIALHEFHQSVGVNGVGLFYINKVEECTGFVVLNSSKLKSK